MVGKVNTAGWASHEKAASFYRNYVQKYLPYDKAPPANTAYLLDSKVQLLLPVYLKSSTRDFDRIKSAAANFKLLNKQQKEELLNQLYFIFYIYFQQSQLEQKQFKSKGSLARINSKINECHQLIVQLENTPSLGEKGNPDSQETIHQAETSKPLRYLGLDAGRAIAEWIGDFTSVSNLPTETTKTTRDLMTSLNNERLQWVWSKLFLMTILQSLVPRDFFHNTQAQANLNQFGVITGYMSFVLYYARFALNFSLLLKHTIKGPILERELHRMKELPKDLSLYKNSYIWTVTKDEDGNPKNNLVYIKDNGEQESLNFSDDTQIFKKLGLIMLSNEDSTSLFAQDIEQIIQSENPNHDPWTIDELKQLSPWERFKTQWNLRKYTLLNDSIWGLANMACFFWLVGTGSLGLAGNGLTGVLLIMDLTLAIWAFMEESTAHNQRMLQLETDIQQKNGEIVALEQELNRIKALNRVLNDNETKDKEDKEKKLAMLYRDLAKYKKAQEQEEFDWRYTKYNFISLVSYSAGLLIAFSMVCNFYAPASVVNSLLIPASFVTGHALSPIAMMGMGVGGAAFCFLFTVLYAVATGVIDIRQSKGSAARIKEEYLKLLEEFKTLSADMVKEAEATLLVRELAPDIETTEESDGEIRPSALYLDLENKRRALYIQLKGLEVEMNYHEAMARYQTVKMIRSLLIDAMIPVVVFSVGVMFFPGFNLAAIGVMAAGFALVTVSRAIMERFEPKMAAVQDKDNEYEKFCENPVAPFLKGSGAHGMLAAKKPTVEEPKKAEEDKDASDPEADSTIVAQPS